MFMDRIRVLDGGLSSAIEQIGGFSLDGDPLWTARLLNDNPSSVVEVHKKFLESGADIITTSSYQASISGFGKYCQLSETEALNLVKKSVVLAKEALHYYQSKDDEKEILVGGSVGPYGACLADGSEYSGAYVDSLTETELQEWHRPRIEALISAGVDFLIVETIPSLQEALSILELMQKDFPTEKCWVTFSCKDGTHTNYGDKFSQAVKACFSTYSNQLVGIGINCTPPKFISSLLEEAAKSLPASTLPRIVYPNSGGWYDSGVGWSKEENNEVFTRSLIDKWINLGAKVIGGCCQVLPSDIKVLSDLVKGIAKN